VNEAAERRGGFAKLREFVRTEQPAERCEMCSIGLRATHQHLIEPISRKLVCACDACAILFSSQGGTKYKRVPRTVRFLSDFQLTDSQWDGLMLPINMAFFFKSTPQDRIVVLYPSPAGAMESMLSLDSWEEIERENPQLEEMEADVEALLVNRIGHSRGFLNAEYYLTPMDECYKLVGLIRSEWNGLSGGTAVWQTIAAFFADLKTRSTPVAESSHA
jgi:hypothetical protein